MVVNIFSNLAFNNREIKVFGGDQLRPNIHIKDMVRAYIILLEASEEKVSGEIFNAGYENVSVLDLAKLTKNVLGENIKLTKFLLMIIDLIIFLKKNSKYLSLSRNIQ